VRSWRSKPPGDAAAGEQPPGASDVLRAGDLLAVYGELLSAPDVKPGPRLADGCQLLGGCWIPGVLLDLGDFPGLVRGDGQVLGELWRVGEPSILEELDRFEGYDREREEESEYVRRRVELLEPQLEAWVYLYNGSPEGRPRVESGDWLGHVADRRRLR
jgi:gamma-glutamylcyclotransferase (GGCT)/AIG2-like uncharacterized protein YtfP